MIYEKGTICILGGSVTVNHIPKDPAMLLSYVNMQLRDHYLNLEDFCISLDIEERFIIDKLLLIDYVYDSNTNQFI